MVLSKKCVSIPFFLSLTSSLHLTDQYIITIQEHSLLYSIPSDYIPWKFRTANSKQSAIINVVMCILHDNIRIMDNLYSSSYDEP